MSAGKGQCMDLGIELLRILAMLGIILFHFSDHGMVKFHELAGAPLTANWLFLGLFAQLGGIGNCVFVLITGSLLWNRPFNVARLLRLWWQVFFFTALSAALYHGISGTPVSVGVLLTVLFPISNNAYWFISTYTMLMLVVPFINALLRILSRAEHLFLVSVMFVALSVFGGADKILYQS